MKYLLIILILLAPFWCFSQNLSLEISNPQPRLGEDFTLTVNMDTVSAKLFNGFSGNFNLNPFADAYGSKSQLTVNMHAAKLGKNQVGPINLTINGGIYRTNKLEFEIVDSLPAVNQGIWIRLVPIDDTSLYILLEQRIPALKYTNRTGNSINITTKTNDDVKEIALQTDSVSNLSFNGSHSTTQVITSLRTRDELNFEYFFACYKLTKPDKTKPVIISKNDFNNLPDYYIFKDIIIK